MGLNKEKDKERLQAIRDTLESLGEVDPDDSIKDIIGRIDTSGPYVPEELEGHYF